MLKLTRSLVIALLGCTVLSLIFSRPAEAVLAFDLPSEFDWTLSGQSATSLYFFSEPGDYIGQGTEWYYSDPAANFSSTHSSGALDYLNFHFDDFSIVDFQSATWWNVDLAAPIPQDLVVGFYDGATRFPFQDFDAAGLSATGDGRGCNQSGGRFEIVELAYGPGDAVNRLDAFFGQYCENESGAGTPALFGRVRFNASVVPEPASMVLFGLGALGLISRRRSRRSLDNRRRFST